MSNYYKGSISLSPLSLSTICKGILTPNGSTIPDISNNYFKQLGLPIVAATFSGVTLSDNITINEKPNSLGYLYNETDISQYCIAPYVESNGTTFTSIPTWCKNIRAILIGAGGNGATGNLGFFTHVAAVNVNTRENQNIDVDFKSSTAKPNEHRQYQDGTVPADTNQERAMNTAAVYQSDYHQKQEFHITVHGNLTPKHIVRNVIIHHHNIATYNVQNAGASGGGGGGGGFVYLKNIDVQGKTISIEGGGLLQHTTLKVQTTTYTAAKGVNAPGVTAGTGGTVTGTGTATTSVVGNAGNASTGGKSGFYAYLNTFPYGNGGNGGAGGVSATSPNPSDGIPGQAGYYRIYFLTD